MNQSGATRDTVFADLLAQVQRNAWFEAGVLPCYANRLERCLRQAIMAVRIQAHKDVPREPA